MTDPDALRGLLERATHDIKEGWPEAAYDSIVRVMRLAIAEELAPLRLALERIEASGKRKLPAPLKARNQRKGREAQERRRAILDIVCMYDHAPSPKEIRQQLAVAGFTPLPEPSTIEADLRAIRSGMVSDSSVTDVSDDTDTAAAGKLKARYSES